MTNQIKIDIGVPVPDKRRAGRKPLYPFIKLQIGESFFIETAKPNQVANTLASSSFRYKPSKFTVRQVEGGVRCWRTA